MIPQYWIEIANGSKFIILINLYILNIFSCYWPLLLIQVQLTFDKIL